MRIARQRCSTRPGSVLFAVLVMVVLLTLAAFQFSELMLQEYGAAQSALRATQSRALADSGVYYAAAMLATPDNISGQLNGNLYDNESGFHRKEVFTSEDGKRTGRFSIVAPIDRDEGSSSTFRYGVVDESGKLNLNALIKSGADLAVIHEMLMKLPNMTDEIADSIINWILEPGRTPRPNGAENSYYSALQPPYRCKNGPLDSIEELLLVRGVTPDLLFGTDHNRNGIDDPGEDTGSGWDPGWVAYLTVYSRFRNVDSEGNPRLNLNGSISQTYYDSLNTAVGQPLADFVVLSSAQASDLLLPFTKASSDEIKTQTLRSIIEKGQTKPTLTSAWDLLQKQSVRITVRPQPGPQGGPGQTISVPNPLADQGQLPQLLPLLLDKTTTQSGTDLPARVNVLTAPRAVLTCLPGLTDADVQAIVETRPALATGEPTDAIYKTTAWLMLDSKMSVDRMRTLERYITSRSQVYRVQSLGYFDQGGPVSRVEAIIDTNNGKPRILMWRDLSDLGKGYNLEN